MDEPCNTAESMRQTIHRLQHIISDWKDATESQTPSDANAYIEAIKSERNDRQQRLEAARADLVNLRNGNKSQWSEAVDNIRYRVHLVKTFGRTGGTRTLYVKSMWLAIPPFKGLSICLPDKCDGWEIEDVWINEHGAVICDLGDDIWNVGDGSGCDVSEKDWEGQKAYMLQGWQEGDWETITD